MSQGATLANRFCHALPSTAGFLAYLRVLALDYKFHISYFGDNSHGYVKGTSVVLYSERNLSELVKEGKVRGTKARAAALAEVARAAAEGGHYQ